MVDTLARRPDTLRGRSARRRWRFSLWSLLDVLELFAGFNIGASLVTLERCRNLLRRFAQDGATPELEDDLTGALSDLIAIVANEKWPSPSTGAQLQRLLERVGDGTAGGPQSLSVRVEEVRDNLLFDLQQPRLLLLPPERVELFSEPVHWFGVEVVDQFPTAERDIRDACQCFALAQWTATVFHCMRILELGLRWLGAHLEIPAGDFKDWGQWIDQIEKAIGLRVKNRLTADNSAEHTFLSQSALQFTYFKSAWRNHVAHARESYDENEAERVLTHVRDFMRRLAVGGPTG